MQVETEEIQSKAKQSGAGVRERHFQTLDQPPPRRGPPAGSTEGRQRIADEDMTARHGAIWGEVG